MKDNCEDKSDDPYEDPVVDLPIWFEPLITLLAFIMCILIIYR